MKIEHLKNDEKKIVSRHNFFRYIESMGKNLEIVVKCNWSWNSNVYIDNTCFEVTVTFCCANNSINSYSECYIITSPDFLVIFNLYNYCGVLTIESEGDIDHEFKDDMFKMIKELNNSIACFNLADGDYIKFMRVANYVENSVYNIIDIVNSFVNCNAYFKNDLIEDGKKLIDRVYEINSIVKIIDGAYSLMEEICYENIKNRRNNKINILINDIKGELDDFSKVMLYK